MAPAPVGPVVEIPLPEGRLELFQKEIKRARHLRDQKIAEWQVTENLERYQPAKKGETGVNVGVDFRDVERKKASLFYDTPWISVIPDKEGSAEAAVLHQELLNGLLSDRKMNAKATALKAIQHCLVAIQPAPTKIGFIPTIVDGISVHDEMFFSNLSGQALLLPVDFKDTEYDKSPWLGYDWKMATSQAKREFQLPDEWTPPSGGTMKTTFTEEPAHSGSSDPQCSGVTLYYRTALFDDTVKHPELIRELVLMEGWEGPVKHQDWKCQELDVEPMLMGPMGPQPNPNVGRLTSDSCLGYPLHLLTLRDLPDSAWVPADSSQTGPLTKEINTYLDQTKAQRDSNRLILLTDVDKIDSNAIERVKQLRAEFGFTVVPVQGGALASGADSVMKQVPGLELGRETYAGLDRFERHRDQILGISSNQAGVQNQKSKTATENAIIQRNSEARFEQERQRVLEWWLCGIRNKLSPLVMRYGDRLATEILGPQRGAQWVQFRDAGMLGPFSFELSIDSGKYIDVEAKRRQTLQLFNLLAKSPFMNQQFLHQQVCQEFGWEQAKALVQPEPPKPDPPKLTLSISGQDLAGPQGPVCLDILKSQGIQISPEAVANMLKMQQFAAVAEAAQATQMGGGLEAKHGGPADKAERIDQHMGRETGGINNAPEAAGPVM